MNARNVTERILRAPVPPRIWQEWGRGIIAVMIADAFSLSVLLNLGKVADGGR
jgi:uncharacterized membrane protein AbrB (regulator of aidB expression)